MTPIGDYALIGNGRSAALVSRGGSIDWLCWPRFDSPSLFAAILDEERGGRWQIHPTGPYRATRRYVGDSNVLETRFETASGTCTLTDLMPIRATTDSPGTLAAEHELIRLVTCERGEVELESRFAPRPGYGADAVVLKNRGAHGIAVEARGSLVLLRSDVAHRLHGSEARCTVRLRAPQTFASAITFNSEAPAVLPALGATARAAMFRTVEMWEEWASRAQYTGPYRDLVIRSALTLKLLAYTPSGAIIAAPTTSLPERLGGDLNWDYRFCWLRDASLTARALFGLGYDAEGDAFVSWLLHSTWLGGAPLAPLYTVFGALPSKERELSHLTGHGASRPVRVGNAAALQLQLDVYGQVIDAAAQLVGQSRRADAGTTAILRRFGQAICDDWRAPDEGIWELRTPPQRHTLSLALCAAGLERLLALGRARVVESLPLARYERHRDEIRAIVEARGYNAQLGSYVSDLDGEEVDASLLLLPRFGYVDAAGPRMKATVTRILERLSAGRSLLYRFPPGLVGGEGAFAICSFWAVDCLARGAGTLEEAHRRFEDMLTFANDVGLFGEEVEPATGAALGNFPQAYTHVGVIDAALSLEEARRNRGSA